MALEITYAEVRFKTESKTSGTNSLPPDAPKEKTTFQQNNPGFLRLFLATLLIFFLLLAISFLVAFIIFFQKYSKLLQEKKTLTESSQKHSELECIKTSSTTEGLSDPEGQRHWQWVDHTPYNESATFWHSRQSNDIYNQCVMVTRYYHQWGWNAVSCNSKLHSICEMMKIYL
ncbi:PREDICTED: C-type lectin domain family 4 member A-like isoform X3 [Chinchilla lanigera]|uniref:C-type lectin domain family 4 member A-like isoform X3 n=1 Tax=Chinchilla lanigera TaxID=34839 RepID=UPI0006980701|nr:PREDICTED: C-type lectin domain family 4 member A-like isoform X3 [Chinchilla lanigera]